MVTSVEPYQTKIEGIPYSDNDIIRPELRAYSQDILRLSYPGWAPGRTRASRLPKIDGVMAPRLVFLLGCVVCSGPPLGLLVVDIQHRDRSLWLICLDEEKEGAYWPSFMKLLGRYFPGSLSAWERTLPATWPILFDTMLASNGRISNGGMPVVNLVKFL